MKQATIKDAIIAVLRKEGKSLSAKDIYQKINDGDYYEFGAKNPVHIVSTVLRQHCDGIEVKKSSKVKYFTRLKDGSYSLANINIE